MQEEPVKLKPKHQEFVNNYFLMNMNATDAYQATYPKSNRESARRDGSRLLTNADIQAEIERRLKEKAMQADEVIARLSDMGRASIARFAGVRTAEDLTELEDAHLVKKLERTITTDSLGRQHEKIKIEMHDAQAALQLIGKHHGIFDRDAGSSEEKPFVIKVVYDDHNPNPA